MLQIFPSSNGEEYLEGHREISIVLETRPQYHGEHEDHGDYLKNHRSLKPSQTLVTGSFSDVEYIQQ